MATDLERVDQDLWDAVKELELPFLLIDLSDFRVSYATTAFLAQMAVPASVVIGKPVFNLLADEDHDDSMFALQALADGKIDFYRSHRYLRATARRARGASFWVCSVEFGASHFALAEATASLAAQDSPLVEFLGYSPPEKAVGIVDEFGVVLNVSNNVKSVLGIRADELVGRHLLNSAEHRHTLRLLDKETPGAPSGSISLPAHALNHIAGERNVRCVVTALANSRSKCFILISRPDPRTTPNADRAAQLEHRLWRIASEVQASGIFDSMSHLPDSAKFPQLSSLNARQWEVLSRLLRGERVSTIAEELFVSQSTIRNNLSAIFKKFGVHSQAELTSLLIH